MIRIRTTRKLNRSLQGNVVNLIFVSALAYLMLVPMLFVINNAFKPLDELFLFPPKIFVQNPTLDNFRDLLQLMGNSYVPVSRYLFNTVFITAAGTLFHVLCASVAAYVLEKHRFPGKQLFFSAVVTSLMFSAEVTGIPNFMMMSKLGLIDTHYALILPAVSAPLGLFLMKQFMAGVPDAVIEAAKIDGCGELALIFRIVMPMVRPAWLTLIIFSVQNLWNQTGGVFIRTETLKTLPFALEQIIASGIVRAGTGAAVGLILMIVPVAVFIVSQRYVLDTMSTSGLK